MVYRLTIIVAKHTRVFRTLIVCTFIKTDETSAPVTGVALSSIYKFLILEVVDMDTVNIADALHQIVDAVTSCRFEVTDPASEEVVLMKIHQVLLACMKNKDSAKLSNQHVCNIVNTCF